MSDINGKAVHILFDEGTSMTLESVRREGNQMTVRGVLFGWCPATMHTSPENAWKMIRMFLNPQMIGYGITLCFVMMRKRLAVKHQGHVNAA